MADKSWADIFEIPTDMTSLPQTSEGVFKLIVT